MERVKKTWPSVREYYNYLTDHRRNLVKLLNEESAVIELYRQNQIKREVNQLSISICVIERKLRIEFEGDYTNTTLYKCLFPDFSGIPNTFNFRLIESKPTKQ